MPKPEIEIRPLDQLSFDELYEAHLLAFKDYPFQWSRDALKKTVYRRGFEPRLSFGAFDSGRLVSFTFNGTGTYKGLRSAYDAGTGTIETHRGRGLASKIFEASIPFLKAEGLKQYILEVLEDNKKAYSVYDKQGFEVSRKFDCFLVDAKDWKMPEAEPVTDIHLKEIGLSYQPQMAAMPDFGLSWQNSFESLLRNPAELRILGAFRGETLTGYGIIEPESGDIPQLAVAKNERRKGIGSVILQELRQLNKADIAKVVNVEAGQEAVKGFLKKNGIPKIVSQFEMIRSL